VLLPAPRQKIRITLADKIPVEPGIYIISYLGKIIYVGKTEESVKHRLTGHMTNSRNELLGSWMRRVDDWENIGLDVLVPPNDVEDLKSWLRNAEAACIKKFSPLFNFHLMNGANS
jgi:excinuclease UvrABC nuclease subunit